MARFELNIAVDGRHFAKVVWKDIPEQTAVQRARKLASLAVDSDLGNVVCSLTRWDEVGTYIKDWEKCE